MSISFRWAASGDYGIGGCIWLRRMSSVPTIRVGHWNSITSKNCYDLYGFTKNQKKMLQMVAHFNAKFQWQSLCLNHFYSVQYFEFFCLSCTSGRVHLRPATGQPRGRTAWLTLAISLQVTEVWQFTVSHQPIKNYALGIWRLHWPDQQVKYWSNASNFVLLQCSGSLVAASQPASRSSAELAQYSGRQTAAARSVGSLVESP